MRDRTCAIARESIGCAHSPGTDVAAPCTVFRSKAATRAPGGEIGPERRYTGWAYNVILQNLRVGRQDLKLRPPRALAGTIQPCTGGNRWRRAVPIASALR